MIISFGACLLYIVASVGCGVALMRLFGWRIGCARERFPAASELGIAFGLGLCALAEAWTVIALFGFLSASAVLSVLVIAALAAIILSRRLIQDVMADAATGFLSIHRGHWTVRTVFVLTVGLVILHGLASILPLSAWSDPVTFYMTLPKITAFTGRLSPLPGYFENFGVIGFIGEPTYAAILTIASDITAKSILWPVGIATALAMSGIGRFAGLGLRGQLVLAAGLFSSTVFTILIGDGKVDLFGTLAGVIAVLLTLNSGPRQPLRGLAPLLGLALGFALVGKLTFIAALLPSVILLVVWRHIGPDVTRANWFAIARQTAAALSIMALMTIVAFLPHFLKNAVMFGAPLAPFYDPAHHIDRYQGGGVTLNSWTSFLRVFFLYPFFLSYGRISLQYGTLSPLFVILTPLIMLVPRPRYATIEPLLQIAVAAVLGILLYTILQPFGFMPRYFLVSTLLLLVPGAWAADRLWTQEGLPSVRSAIGFALIATLLLSGASLIRMHRDWWAIGRAVPYLTGKIDKCQFSGEACKAADELAATAEPGARVYNFAYASSYWLRPDLLACGMRRSEIIHDSTHNIDLGDDQKKWNFVTEHGFEFMFVDTCAGGYPWKPGTFPHPTSAPAWLNVETVRAGACFQILRLRPREGAPAAKLECRKLGAADWRVLDKPAP